jgi:hypothetical protein
MKIQVAIALVVLTGSASAHDYKRPDLDQWYEKLYRNRETGVNGRISCCSKYHCHPTETEVRIDGHWWARLGVPTYDGDRVVWLLGEYRKVPDELIIRDNNGRPVGNPEGEPVICHNMVRKWTGEVYWDAIDIWCFVPGLES